MTPQAWYSANAGKALLVPGQPASLAGQCEQAVDCYIHDALGLPYVYTPIAANFWNLFGSLSVLNQNFDQITNGQFLNGDIVVYSSALPGSEGSGHVDIVAAPGSKSSYLGYDSNWGGNLTLHQVAHADANNAYILGSLRKKGNNKMLSEDDVRWGYLAVTGAQPTADQIKYWVGRDKSEFLLALYHLGDEYVLALQKEVKALGSPTPLGNGIYKVGP